MIVKEPLLHFAVLALLIFVAYAAFTPKVSSPSTTAIVVRSAKIEQMAAVFTKTWQRPPTDAELKGLVDDYVAEEVLVREALALGLDRDDTVIRRRLRQKMEFMSDAEVDALAPSDAELQAYLEAHAAAYQVDPKIDFAQIFLSPYKRGDAVQADAAALLAQLQANPEMDVSNLGDASLLPGSVPPTEVTRIGNDFGPDFASSVAELPVGTWAGPIASAFGLHLVRVSDRQSGRTLPLAEVRDAVLRDWSNDARMRQSKAQLEPLMSKYTVTIDIPKAAAP
jgi:hypothetical protein